MLRRGQYGNRVGEPWFLTDTAAVLDRVVENKKDRRDWADTGGP
jgi:hypothetical protein